jgi:uncharacterized protein YxjI
LNAKFQRDKFLLHEKHFTIGDKYQVCDDCEVPLFFVEREKFKVHADIHVYDDESKTREVLTVKDKSVFDFKATMEVVDPETGELLGSLKRNPLLSIIRRTWEIRDRDGNKIGCAREDSILKSLLRRFAGRYGTMLKTDFIFSCNGTEVGKFIRRWTIADRYVLDLSGDSSGSLDRRLAVGLGILLDSAEAR